MASRFPNQSTRQAVRLRNLSQCQADSVLIEMEDVLSITFEHPTSDPIPVPVGTAGDGPPAPDPIPAPVGFFLIPVPASTAAHPHILLRCTECDRPGHWSYQCLGGSPEPGACSECGSPDHHLRACPIPAGRSLTPLSDSYFCHIHRRPRGYRNIMKDGFGGWRCKPDSECPLIGGHIASHPPKRYRLSSTIRG